MLALTSLTSLLLSAVLVGASPLGAQEKRDTTADSAAASSYEYIVVGSGAGGGPLAARLALNGANVLLIEAGDDQGTTPQQSIPAFFPASSEFAPMSWDFYVRHYPNDDAREKSNSKATYKLTDGTIYVGTSPPAGATFLGIWYPRAGTLGGSAAHNAMVTIYPHEKDWQLIQNLTGDASWAPAKMRPYFQRIEKNQYITDKTSAAAQGHGFNGWLGTDEMNLNLILNDKHSLAMVNAASSAFTGKKQNASDLASLQALYPLDMNAAYPNRDKTQNFYRVPESILNGARSSPRDLLVQTAASTGGTGKLTIRTNTLVTKVRFDTTSTTPRAVGVDYLDGAYLYSASTLNNGTAGTPGSVNATKEVIISGGTFNTPQILKLSGVGPAAELKKFGIKVIKDLPGVGANLQDHYEISTVIENEQNFDLLEQCTWLSTGTSDPCYQQYTTGTNFRGPYATNLLEGAVLLKSKSSPDGTRDTFIFGGAVKFTGYFQGYTAAAIADTFHWSWLVLKSHEGNHAGSVTLRSADPKDVPQINFNYFDAGDKSAVAGDMAPLLEGLKFTRNIYGNLSDPYKNFTEVYPGSSVKTDAGLADFVQREAWGHHACGTAKIGASTDKMAVLDSKFKVRGINGLRVVDASVFPEIPGYFPVVAIYMLGEKAADQILADNAATAASY